MGKIFKFVELTFLENALIWGIVTHVVPHSELASKLLSSRPRQKEITCSRRQHSFEIFLPQQQKGMEETIICFIKIQPENMKMTRNIRFFIFCMICNFFRCDGFTILWITYLSYSIVLILLFLLCNHDNLILKLHQKKIDNLMKGDFL